MPAPGTGRLFGTRALALSAVSCSCTPGQAALPGESPGNRAPKTPPTSQSIPKAGQATATPGISLPRSPETHCGEGLCGDTRGTSQPLAVLPWHPVTPITPHPPAPWLHPKVRAPRGCAPGWGPPHEAPAGAGGSSSPLLGAAGLTFIFRRELYKLAFLSGLSSRNCVKLNGNELH